MNALIVALNSRLGSFMPKYRKFERKVEIANLAGEQDEPDEEGEPQPKQTTEPSSNEDNKQDNYNDTPAKIGYYLSYYANNRISILSIIVNYYPNI